jgi:hypothetical protein
MMSHTSHKNVSHVYFLFIFWLDDPGLISMIYSADRNVGKSLTLQILAKAQDIGIDADPLDCSGGDQTISGASL